MLSVVLSLVSLFGLHRYGVLEVSVWWYHLYLIWSSETQNSFLTVTKINGILKGFGVRKSGFLNMAASLCVTLVEKICLKPLKVRGPKIRVFGRFFDLPVTFWHFVFIKFWARIWRYHFSLVSETGLNLHFRRTLGEICWFLRGRLEKCEFSTAIKTVFRVYLAGVWS